VRFALKEGYAKWLKSFLQFIHLLKLVVFLLTTYKKTLMMVKKIEDNS